MRRTLGVNVGVDPSYSQPLNNMAWNYIWAKATGSACDMTIGQSVNVATPLYVEGNLCLQNTATISSGPLVVRGSLTMSQKANGVGQPSAPVNEAHIGGACQYWNKAADYPCKGNPDNVYAHTLDQNVPALTPPAADWTKWYLNGDPGPYYPCIEKSGTPPAFDNDQGNASTRDATKRNNSVLTVFDLTPGLSYACKNPGGELSWNASSHVLTVKGTVYIDGSVVVEKVEGEIEANNLNGPVTLTHVSGVVVAHSLNGEVTTQMDRVTPEKPMSFSTLNGDIDVTLPPDIKAKVKLETQNGAIYSDFEISLDRTGRAPTVEDGRKDGGKYRIVFDKGVVGAINGGGPEFQFKTVNGNIHIRKGK